MPVVYFRLITCAAATFGATVTAVVVLWSACCGRSPGGGQRIWTRDRRTAGKAS